MMKNLAHIGIAVKDLEKSCELFGRLLGVAPEHVEAVPSQGVRTAMFRMGAAMLELLAPDGENSPVARSIEKRGEGIHHLSFIVDDIQQELARLREAGFELVEDRPRPGVAGDLVAFLHPRSTNGVLIEISQPTGDSERKNGYGGS